MADQATEVPEELELQQNNRSPWFVVGGVIAALTFGVWIFGWIAQANNKQIDLRTGEERTAAPDLFDDSTLSLGAEMICSAALSQVNSLTAASIVTSPEERADNVVQATIWYSDMLSELEGLTPATTRDHIIFSGWLADWQTHIDDRQFFAQQLADGNDAQFVMSDRAGERLDRIINRIANTNEMYSCAFPVDVG